MRIDCLMMRGINDTSLRIYYSAEFDLQGQYQNIRAMGDNRFKIYPSFSIKFSKGADGGYMWLKQTQYIPFVTLLEKSIKLISDNLYEIFPDVNKTEFEADTKMLAVYQTEKALSMCGLTLAPCVWVNETEECFPGIQIYSQNAGFFKMSMEDAIVLSKLLSVFDPINMYMSLIQSEIK